MFHQRYSVILSLKYLVLDVNIIIQSDKSLVLGQAATISQRIDPGLALNTWGEHCLENSLFLITLVAVSHHLSTCHHLSSF